MVSNCKDFQILLFRTCHVSMFACDHNKLKCSISPDCWWHQFKTKTVWQEMILRPIYYRCLNCFCLFLFPGNEDKWIEKCRWTWTAGGEIDSSLADIPMLETHACKGGIKEAETAGRPSPPTMTPLCSCWMLFVLWNEHTSLNPQFLLSANDLR